MLKSEYKKINFKNISKKDAENLKQQFLVDCNSTKQKLKERLLEEYLEDILEWLHSREWYDITVNLLQKLWINNSLDYLYSSLFEAWFAFGQIWDNLNAEKFYLKYLELHWESSAVYNNLGVIYEKLENFTKAKEYFQMAQELDSDNEKAKDNYNNISKKLKQQEEINVKMMQALESFKKENPYVFDKITSFYRNADTNGVIICPWKLLPKYIWASADKSHELIKAWLEKLYIIKLSKKDPETGSTCYQINKYISNFIKEKWELQWIEKKFLIMTESLSIDGLEKIWYNNGLISKVNQCISNTAIKGILERDIFDLAQLVLLWLHKSALILWWSVIETILIDKHERINIKKIESLKWKSILLYRAELADLIESWYKKKIVWQNIYYLCHGVRGFRNLVHPWAEHRSQELEVSADNVNIVWTIVKTLILWLKQ